MKGKKVKKEHEWSSIEVNFVMHQFVLGDESHPERDEIYQMLDEMARKLNREGHVVITSDVLHDIDEEEKENALCLHSERLAIAYGLLRLPKESTIRIVKNLRLCIDCHSAIKLISAIYKREIIKKEEDENGAPPGDSIGESSGGGGGGRGGEVVGEIAESI
ncbi:hypothetical protein LguiA_003285 [Lonicera macranthoides]